MRSQPIRVRGQAITLALLAACFATAFLPTGAVAATRPDLEQQAANHHDQLVSAGKLTHDRLVSITPTKAIKLVRSAHSTAQLEAKLSRLRRADRRYVITMALTPARTVVTQSGTTIPVRGAANAHIADATPDQLIDVLPIDPWGVALAEAAGACRNYSHDFTAKSYSWLGLWQFTYHSDWQWRGCHGIVTKATHQERGDTAIGWSYDGRDFGRAYGKLGAKMVGRDTFGHFSFIKYAVHDNAELQAQVHGDGGWWAGANITGP